MHHERHHLKEKARKFELKAEKQKEKADIFHEKIIQEEDKMQALRLEHHLQRREHLDKEYRHEKRELQRKMRVIEEKWNDANKGKRIHATKATAATVNAVELGDGNTETSAYNTTTIVSAVTITGLVIGASYVITKKSNGQKADLTASLID